jgi:hypothetical protein
MTKRDVGDLKRYLEHKPGSPRQAPARCCEVRDPPDAGSKAEALATLPPEERTDKNADAVK